MSGAAAAPRKWLAGPGAAAWGGAAAVALLAAAPLLLGARYALSTLTEVLIFALFAMSLDLLLGYAGLPSLGHAAFFGVGAYAAGLVALRTTPSLLVTLPVAAGVAAAVAAAVGRLSVRASGVYLLMLTLAFAQVLYAAAHKWDPVTGGSDGLAGVPRPTLPGLDLGGPVPFYYATAAVALLGYWALRRIVGAPFGHALMGIRENEARMEAIGYDTRRYKVGAFALAGGFAGLAGALYVHYSGFVSPHELYWTQSGSVLLMVIVGGAGTLVGPALGAALVLLLQNFASSYTERWLMVMGVVFVAFVLFAPDGVAGVGRRLLGRRAWTR
jgi:branched-chain amino acid transport system permease protein